VLSNLGMSYMLTKDLPKAEQALRQAYASPQASAKVRQNLGLVVGLQGRFAEAEQIVKADLPPDEAEANVAYLRDMLKGQEMAKDKAKDNSRPGRSSGNIPVAELDRGN
jgi:Flp pilus assembly protein TadD